MSTVRRTDFSGLALTRYRRPIEWMADRKANSGRVSRCRFARMIALTEGLLAHDSLMRRVLRGRASSDGDQHPCAVHHFPRLLQVGPAVRPVDLANVSLARSAPDRPTQVGVHASTLAQTSERDRSAGHTTVAEGDQSRDLVARGGILFGCSLRPSQPRWRLPRQRWQGRLLPQRVSVHESPMHPSVTSTLPLPIRP